MRKRQLVSLGALLCACMLVPHLMAEDPPPLAESIADVMMEGPSNVAVDAGVAVNRNNMGATVPEKPALVMTNLGGKPVYVDQGETPANSPLSGSRALAFDLSPGTGAAPGTLGGFIMTPFPLNDEDPPPGSDVTYVTSPCGWGQIDFSIPLNHRRIQGAGGYGYWGSWSHGYVGDVYYTNGAVSVTITLPQPACAFYFYVEPNPFGVTQFTAVGDDGASSGSFGVEGSEGAQYVGIYGEGLVSVTISSDNAATDFAIGEFGIACGCEPVFGACCDPATGICDDDVSGADCAAPSQFTMDTLCSALYPACGNPGACCDDETAVCTDPVLELNCPGRFAGGEECAEHEWDPPCGEWQPTGMLYAPTEDDNPTFRASVEAITGSPCDYFDPRVSTPTLEQLIEYHCVLTWVNYAYADAVGMGDVLADYLEAGGKVILGQWTADSGQTNKLAGRIMDDYPLVVLSGRTSGSYAGDGITCIHLGVTSYSSDYWDDIGTVVAPAMVDGTRTDGLPAVVYAPAMNHFYSGGNTGDTYSSGDWAQLSANMCGCTAEPMYGSCCDPATGICTDDVELMDCLPPLQFGFETLCSALWPPCGNPGACCDIHTGDCVDDVLELDCPVGDRFEGDGECAEMEPACGTPGCCCFPEDGENPLAPYEEFEANCEGRFLPGVTGGDCVGTAFDPECGLWTCEGILYAPAQPDNATWRAQVAAITGGTVDFWDASASTPTLEDLSEYCCVFTWVNYAYADNVAMGDVLADFVDQGGKVMLGQWCLPTAGNYLAGRVMTAGYMPATASSYTGGTYAGDGLDCVHLLGPVSSMDSGYWDQASALSGAVTSGTVVETGLPAVIWRSDRGVYSSPGNTGNDYTNGDTAQLVANMCNCGDGPMIGACCDLTTGICVDDVDALACEGQFHYQGLCAELVPPCGNPGACCDDDTGVCTQEFEVNCPGRFAAGEDCAEHEFDPPCGEYHACPHEVVMLDDYGDGWNDGFIDIYVDGMLVASGVTLASGTGPESFFFEAGTDSVIQTVWTDGGWAYECSYFIYDQYGTELCSDGDGGDYPSGVTCTGNCEAPAGACCLGLAGCEIISEEDCDAAGGTYLGDFTDCGTMADCDEDGETDMCAILTGTAQDCNGNDIPDSCDIANCGIVTPVITIEILTDYWGYETTWELIEQGGGVVASGGPYDGSTSYTIDVDVDPDSCYDFTIDDDYGNGIYSPGGFTISYGGEVVADYMDGGFTGNTMTVSDIGGGCAGREACQHSITMWDSYGNGWNGCTIDVYVNGDLVLEGATIGDGDEETVYFDADTGDEIFVDFTADSWATETSYCVYDGGGAELGCADGGYDPGDGDLTVTGNCEIPFECDPDAWCQDCQPNGIPDGCELHERTPVCGDGECSPGEDCESCPEDCGECPETAIITIEVMTDDYGNETTWELVEQGGGIVASGGPYDPYLPELYTYNVEVSPTSCYDFTIYDSWGNGICCSYGTGYYNVYYEGDLVGSGGDFGTSETVSDIGGGCDGRSDAVITIDLLTDAWGYETSWTLSEQGGGVVGSGSGYGDDSFYSIDVDVDSTSCYDFTINDDYGDGIYDPGGFTISYEGDVVADFMGGLFTGASMTVPNIGGGCEVSPTLISQLPNQSNGIFSDCDCDYCGGGAQVLADNFTLSAEATINVVRFWGGMYPSDHPAGTEFAIVFYEDSAGLPGAEVASYTQTGDAAQTGVVLFGVHEWDVSITLDTPLTLGAGTYFVEIRHDTVGDSDSWFWEVGNLDFAAGVMGNAYGFECPVASWSYDAATDMAFELYAVTGPPANDCNENCVPDECDPDCNCDGMPDDCEDPPFVPSDPTIECPDDVVVICPESTDPADTGMATGLDNCGNPAVITYSDEVTDAEPYDTVMYTITRTWTSTDECAELSVECVQTITVMKDDASLIIKQGACPAPVNRTGHGIVKMALTGDVDFDVYDVVQDTVRLIRVDGVGGEATPSPGSPPGFKFADINHPYVGDPPCSCNDNSESDGIMDLEMKFRTDDLVAALLLDELPGGTIVGLALVGELANGCEFIAFDCIRIVPPGGYESVWLIAESNLTNVWVVVSPLDDTLDGEGYCDFERSYPQGTVVTLTTPQWVWEGHRFIGWEVDGVFVGGGLSIDVPFGSRGADEEIVVRAFYNPDVTVEPVPQGPSELEPVEPEPQPAPGTPRPSAGGLLTE